MIPEAKLTTHHLYDSLVEAIDQAEEVYIVAAFAQKSGVALLVPAFRRALQRGAEIRLLIGDYLHITDPEALAQLLALDGLSVRFYRSGGRSFHPKAYLFRNAETGLSIVGSSNISNSALRSGIEWNVHLPQAVAPQILDDAIDAFMDLYLSESAEELNPVVLDAYRQEYAARQYVAEPEVEYDEGTVVVAPEILPHRVQEEALQALRETMEEGRTRALAVLATGLGKTYLSAFFAGDFTRVLFLAHQKELLLQAERSFQKVNPAWQTGFYIGSDRTVTETTEIVFASVQTLAQKRHLDRFATDQFDLIIVDEFHHAAATSYQKIIDYFTPRFLLGLTATPDRMDGADVYAICHHNVAFQMHFTAAIAEGFLTLFHYYGIHDTIDYSQIRRIGRTYDASELEHRQLDREVADNIYHSWEKYRQTKTIGFCSSIKQAEYLAQVFRDKGTTAFALTGQTTNRAQYMQAFEQGEIDVLFTVDLFNEGVDIPKVDTLLFCRPTESVAIYTQQIGRGLRLAQDKSHCVIIDLIGNYRNVETKLKLLGTMKESFKRGEREPITPPPGCVIEFDTRALELIHRLRQPSQRKLRLIEQYEQIKYELGRRPSYVEIGEYAAVPQGYKQEWGSYVGFLKEHQELLDEEIEAYDLNQELIEQVEKTIMNRSYKMVVLLAMLERGEERWMEPITAEEVAPFFYEYLHAEKYRKLKDAQTAELKGPFDPVKVERLLKKMPFPKMGKPFKTTKNFENLFFQIPNEVFNINTLKEIINDIVNLRIYLYFNKNSKK
ncbi:restriction endonuclease subunit R [Exiguobacterium sp. U13-1]|uniref:DEAD/DEAH box helicase family protein n=1 Tax=Exiguobacterium sp. U13-1 TaxID=1849031 RepID=UPI0008596B7E|nr:DEAD/DEAH box helicase family protein [Exiguobacterium sp. U13-1]AOS99480.1 restriction endonuclease subunit R [Exiguobacterium sp. U13-1]